MLEIGKTVSLQVLRVLPIGLILGDADDEVLLPRRYAPSEVRAGDELEVFLYTDSEDRPIATTERPVAEADEFASMRVVSVGSAGAFLDWGLPKDLLLPFRNQLQRVQPGQQVVVRVLLDSVSGRPVATARVERFLERASEALREGQTVDLLIYEETELGSKAIIDGCCAGLLYRNASDDQPEIGSALKGYVQRIRPDGKIDLTLHPSGMAAIEDARDVILAALDRAGGRLELSDQSSPEEVRKTLGLSKKAFKRAVGRLYRERRIQIEDDSIRLIDPNRRFDEGTSRKEIP